MSEDYRFDLIHDAVLDDDEADYDATPTDVRVECLDEDEEPDALGSDCA